MELPGILSEVLRNVLVPEEKFEGVHSFRWPWTPSGISSLGGLGDRRGSQLAARNHAIDDAILDRFVRAYDVVPIKLTSSGVDGLATGIRQNLVQNLAHAEDLFGVDIDIRRLSGQTLHRGLVDHNTGVWQTEPLALLARGEQNCAHRGRLS